MQVSEIMTEDPQCCTADNTLQEAAQLMRDWDCGEIPVVDERGRPIGVITDRDICCRAVAEDRPVSTAVQEIMSSPVITVREDESIERCCELMDEHQIRRVPVVDSEGICCGVVAQADLARELSQDEIGHVVQDISQPSQPTQSFH